MIKKFSKHGNSLALLLDKPILELLNITEDTKIKIRIDGNKLIIEPIIEEPISDDDTLQKIYENLVERHKETLKKLAKN